jgi:hypothetical protein
MEYVTVTKEKYAALLAVVEAARALSARLEREDDPAWDSPSELDALTAALARLEEEQT